MKLEIMDSHNWINSITESQNSFATWNNSLSLSEDTSLLAWSTHITPHCLYTHNWVRFQSDPGRIPRCLGKKESTHHKDWKELAHVYHLETEKNAHERILNMLDQEDGRLARSVGSRIEYTNLIGRKWSNDLFGWLTKAWMPQGVRFNEVKMPELPCNYWKERIQQNCKFDNVRTKLLHAT